MLFNPLLEKDLPRHFLTEGELSAVMYNLDLRDRRISFAIDMVPEADREWFCETLTRQLLEVDARAEKATREQFQRLGRELFGIAEGGSR